MSNFKAWEFCGNMMEEVEDAALQNCHEYIAGNVYVCANFKKTHTTFLRVFPSHHNYGIHWISLWMFSWFQLWLTQAPIWRKQKPSLRTELKMFVVTENNFNETSKHFKVRPLLFLIPPNLRYSNNESVT